MIIFQNFQQKIFFICMIYPASVSFSYFHLLWNHWTDLDQTWQKCSFGRSSTRFVILVQIENPTWLPGPIMCSDWLKLWRRKLLSRWNFNIIEMMTGFIIFVPIAYPRWPPQGNNSLPLDPMGISFKDLFFEKLLDKLNFLHYVNVPWKVLHLIYYFGANWKSNMAARANNVF